MSLRIHLPPLQNEALKPKIAIIGVGGAGGNVVNNMINSGLEGVEFIVANTDAQALDRSLAQNRIQLGAKLTKGLGAGGVPEIARQAAEESINEIAQAIEGIDMLFITAGMGGGTGTGAAHVIARLAMERKILTVGVVTKPFHFEGARRMRLAQTGVEDLSQNVDTYIVINNQSLFSIADEKTTFAGALQEVDKILYFHVREVSSLMVSPGYINLDFADVRSVMAKMGKALLGTGEASGEGRAVKAAEQAIANPLLDNLSVQDAKGMLINITGGTDMTLFEVDAAANCIREKASENVNIIFGSTSSDGMEGSIRVSVVATGICSQDEITEKQEEKNISAANQACQGLDTILAKDNLQRQSDLLEIPAFLRRVKKRT